jgi:hypothetical protein
MNVFDNNDIQTERLKVRINNLREVLNEICSTTEDTENNKKRLIVSRCLDELIVKYMKQVCSSGLKR